MGIFFAWTCFPDENSKSELSTVKQLTVDNSTFPKKKKNKKIKKKKQSQNDEIGIKLC